MTENCQEYAFIDNDPHDTESELEVTITSKQEGTNFKLSVIETKNIRKAVPSETHKLTLPPAVKSPPESIEYHLETATNSVSSLKLLLLSPADQSVEFALRIRVRIDGSNRFEYQEVSLNKTKFKRSGMSFWGVDNQDITIRNGVYILTLSNPKSDGSSKSVQFRFIYNDIVEMEANGMLTSVLNGTQRQVVQIAYPTASEMTLSFFSCSGNLKVYYTKNEQDPRNTGQEIFNDRNMVAPVSSGGLPLRTFTASNTGSDVYYITVKSMTREIAEYTLISRQHDYGAAAESSDLMRLGPLKTITSNKVAGFIEFHFETPIISIEGIKKSYPHASRLVMHLSAIIYAGESLVLTQLEEKIRSGIYCPSNLQKDPDFIQASTDIEIAQEDFYRLPNTVKLRKDINDEYIAKIFRQSFTFMFADVARVLPVAKLYIYQNDDLEPSGVVVIAGNPTKAKTMDLLVLEDSISATNYFETTAGRILMILGMVLLMLVILTVVYFCAHRISGGYSRVEGEIKLTPDLNNSGTEMSGLKSLEVQKQAEI